MRQPELNAPIGTCVVDEHGVFETVSAAYAATYGYTPEEMRGRHFTLIVPPDQHDTFLGVAAERPAAGAETTAVFALLHKQGELVFVRSTTLTITGADGRPRRVSFSIDITEQRRSEQVPVSAAQYDALTGLPNRVLFGDRLEQAMLQARSRQLSLAMLLIDLSRFKAINDTRGRGAGDQVLLAVARRIGEVVRVTDTVARLDADEFAVLLPGTDEAGGLHVANKIRDAVCLPIPLPPRTVTVGASIGIALYPEHGELASVLLRCADTALYVARALEGGAIVYEPDHDRQGATPYTLARELRQAIATGQLRLHYQPVVDCAGGRINRVEALVRWQHPIRGLLDPDTFIPLAEQTGAIDALTLWVLEEALRQSRAWQDQNLMLGVAVNVSMRTLQDPQFPDMIAALLRAHAVAPASLTLEITERTLMTEPEQAMAVLAALAALGVRIAIDDFGIGHSSLGALRQLHLHELKVDRSFTRQADSGNGAALLSFILGLGTTLGLAVVVEGVETRAIMDWLVHMGCPSVQGYFLSRPLPADDLAQWLQGSSHMDLAALRTPPAPA